MVVLPLQEESARISPQHSNRSRLIEGTLRCLQRLPSEQVTAREIAEESGANLASIGYHFGSKDALVTAAVIEGLDRWLEEIAIQLAEVEARPSAERLRRAAEVVADTRGGRTALARSLVAALARAQHDEEVRKLLAAGFQRVRPQIAALLGLGEDGTGEDAAGLVHSMFTGLLVQAMLDPRLAIEGGRMDRAQARLRSVLPRAAS